MRWNSEQVIVAIKAWAESHGGRAPAREEWKNAGPGHPCSGTVINRFGSWGAGIRAAGLTPRGPGPGGGSSWTPEAIIERIHEWHRRFGHPPAASDWAPALAARRTGDRTSIEIFRAAGGYWPSTKVVTRTFGSWSAALAAAGVEPRRPGPRNTPLTPRTTGVAA